MKFLYHFLLLGLIYSFQQTSAQETKPWNGKECAVVLTYDDALNVHLDKVVPCLDSANIRGTFYINGNAATLSKRIDDWREIAKRGHELGNHSLNHPCAGNTTNRSWVRKESDLNLYTVDRAVREIRVMNTLLQAIDGKTERTFAFPCGDTLINSGSFYPLVKNEFVGARGVGRSEQQIGSIDLNYIHCYAMNNESGENMVKLVEEAMKKHTLLVFLFHGVGGDHNLNVSTEAHSQLVHFLKQHENQIWATTMVDAARYIREKQKGDK